MAKLWGGRFKKQTAPAVDHFHSSISFDWRLYPYDIQGSKAHVRMLGRQGIITPEEAQALEEALDEILADIEEGRVELSEGAEDIHMNIEAILIERTGDLGRKLHTARSRNDQVALDTRLYVREHIQLIMAEIRRLQQTLLAKAEANLDVSMPGYTHLQPAQPILFAHHCLAYFHMFQRDWERLADCLERANLCPLGAGALAGVTYPIDREMVAGELGFRGIVPNSLDAVSDRDYILEFLSAGSILMMHLSRYCEEIILWANPSFGFIELDDAYSTGSSIMPQKKNPDVAELIRGKTGRVYGSLMGLLTTMKGLPLAYNKDMQEDKEALFDGVDTVLSCLAVFIPMIETMKINRDAMAEAASIGYLNATDMADYLVQKKGLPFRSAHSLVGQLVAYAIDKGVNLEELSLAEIRAIAPMVDGDVYEHLTVEGCLAARSSAGGTAPREVAAALQRAWTMLEEETWENPGRGGVDRCKSCGSTG
ncbi:MAG: argininosuccinate lyase [Firmicutes bacterium]|nr:argininosuccinate lyase [Bacillota bacterium]